MSLYTFDLLKNSCFDLLKFDLLTPTLDEWLKAIFFKISHHVHYERSQKTPIFSENTEALSKSFVVVVLY